MPGFREKGELVHALGARGGGGGGPHESRPAECPVLPAASLTLAPRVRPEFSRTPPPCTCTCTSWFFLLRRAPRCLPPAPCPLPPCAQRTPLGRAQVASLLCLGLLARESAEADLDHVRLKCCVGPDTVSLVAASVKVDLRKFLHAPEAHQLAA
jgi:hypothetical protein